MINKLVPQLIDQDVLLYLQIQTDFQSKLYNVDTKRYRAKCINPIVPGDFPEKHVLKLVKRFSGHCGAVTTKPVTGLALRGLLIQMQNNSLQSSGMCRKQNFEIFWVQK